MTKPITIFGTSLVVLGAFFSLAGAQPPAQKSARPKVEVVFCLDATGSMGGLIDAAKQKIWTICNQIAAGTPTPQIRIGLVAYRDRGDQFLTKVFDLSDDLDSIHGHLMGLRAQGGGDFPESVNQALHEAVTKIKWSNDKNTLKIIFLVGDAPPHMDYPDDVKYPETCRQAVKNNIIINTIQCGANPETKAVWEKIGHLSEGSYVQIDARGGPVVTIATPFDADLAKINTDLARSTLTFGDRRAQEAGKARAEAAAGLAAPAAADRAGFAGRSGMAAAYDLLDSIKKGKVQLEKLKKDELPEELKKLSLKEQRQYLEKLDRTRQELMKKATELDRKRGTFITQKLAEDRKNRARDSFDQQVLQVIQRQAARVNIRYATEDKKK